MISEGCRRQRALCAKPLSQTSDRPWFPRTRRALCSFLLHFTFTGAPLHFMATESGDDIDQPSIKRRRIPKACAACRKSKLRCDERRPCSRCVNAEIECVYFVKPPDPLAERLEALETRMSAMSHEMRRASAPRQPVMRHHSRYGSGPDQTDSLVSAASDRDSVSGAFASFVVRGVSRHDAVSGGLVTEAEAIGLFDAFFQGCVTNRAFACPHGVTIRRRIACATIGLHTDASFEQGAIDMYDRLPTSKTMTS